MRRGSMIRSGRRPLPALVALLRIATVAGGFVLAASTTAPAQEPATPGVYAPYAFLIGEWDVGPPGGAAAAVTRFRWGSARTYIWYSGSLLVNGREQPTFEGLLVWNGVRKNLDMLLVLEPASTRLVQEQGAVRIESDGTVVRDITVYYSGGNALPPRWDQAAGPDGATAQFRQTFKRTGPDSIATSIMLKTTAGWMPSFPGSDQLVMTRRGRSANPRRDSPPASALPSRIRSRPRLRGLNLLPALVDHQPGGVAAGILLEGDPHVHFGEIEFRLGRRP